MQHMEFLSLNGGCTCCSGLHLPKCHIVGKHFQIYSLFYYKGDNLMNFSVQNACHVRKKRTRVITQHFFITTLDPIKEMIFII